jgi:hypothetical protein
MTPPITVTTVRGKKRAELLADPNFVYVGGACRGWAGSLWANPFKIGTASAAEVVERFQASLAAGACSPWREMRERLGELQGKTLWMLVRRVEAG